MDALKDLRELVPEIDNDKEINVGNDREQHWTLQSHVVNYMERSRRLIKAIGKDSFPPFFIKREIDLIRDRLDALEEHYNQKDKAK